MTWKARMSIRVAAAGLALAMAWPAMPALALEGNPQGRKQKERHVFRDVHLGVSHPSGEGKGTQAAPPPQPFAFPWFFLPVVPSTGAQGGAVNK